MDIHKWLPQFHLHTAIDMAGAQFENIATYLAKTLSSTPITQGDNQL